MSGQCSQAIPLLDVKLVNETTQYVSKIACEHYGRKIGQILLILTHKGKTFIPLYSLTHNSFTP